MDLTHGPDIHGWLKQVVERQLRIPDTGLPLFHGDYPAPKHAVPDQSVFSEGAHLPAANSELLLCSKALHTAVFSSGRVLGLRAQHNLSVLHVPMASSMPEHSSRSLLTADNPPCSKTAAEARQAARGTGRL